MPEPADAAPGCLRDLQRMCGIYGELRLDGTQAERDTVARMARLTRHRGPDDEGLFLRGPVALGMRRLSIIDVAGGQQPFSTDDGDVQAICNGEIYNFQSLRAGLQGAGVAFRSGSDVEVVPHLYRRFGDSFPVRLEGMFAVALWDDARRTLTLVRDRLGIKPLYVYRSAQRILFSSELKALLAGLEHAPEVNQVALGEYLALGYVPDPLTPFHGIEKLLPGSSVRFSVCGDRTDDRYWTPHGRAASSASRAELQGRLLHELEAAVRAQMVSDVPLGAFLSGGIDSSCVVAMMARHSDRPVQTYSIGFNQGGGSSTAAAEALYDELPFARRVAMLLGTEHKEILVTPDVASLLPELIWSLDEPVADSAFLTTYLVSKFAADDVKVILSGVGGDELFGGYRRYLSSHYLRYLDLLPKSLVRSVLVPLMKRLPVDRHSRWLALVRYVRSLVLTHDLDLAPRYATYVGVFQRDQAAATATFRQDGSVSALADAFRDAATSDEVNRLMEVDLVTQLPGDLLMLTDRMSMAVSLECRVPLLDERLVELALTVPGSEKIVGRELKVLLKQALVDLLPRDILYRSKRGFGAPMGAWLKSQLLKLTRETLCGRRATERGWFDSAVVRTLLDDHGSARADNTDHILALLNLELWSRLYIDGDHHTSVQSELAGLANGK